MIREIVKIDEELCDGCGQCVPNCHEEALNYIKANREVMPFSIKEVHELLHGKNNKTTGNKSAGGGCPGSVPQSFDASGFKMAQPSTESPSALTQWPVQLHLVNPAAGYFQGADLLVAADCAGFAHGDFHHQFIAGKKTVIACPKLDQGKEIYIQKFISLIDDAKVNTITTVVMEVPCCGGLVQMVQTAVTHAKRKVPVKIVVVSTRGEVLSEEWALPSAATIN
jgi:ferredoxin